jgi:hypothetical protein
MFAINNYRPISIFSVFSKILEKLMYNRLISYSEAFNILTFEQYGFRKNKSTNTAVQSLVEFIHQSLDNQLHVIRIFLDLTKAYDILNHQILLTNWSHMVLGVLIMHGLSLTYQIDFNV